MRQGHRLIINAAANFTGPVIRLLIGLVLPAIIIPRLLDDEMFGLATVIFTATNMIMYIQMGAPLALTRFLSADLARKDYDSVSRVLSTGTFLLILAGVVAFVFVLAMLLAPEWFLQIPDGVSLGTIRTVILIIGAVVVCSLPMSMGRVCFMVKEKFTTYNLLFILGQFVRAGLVLGLLYLFKKSIVAYTIGTNAGIFTTLLLTTIAGFMVLREGRLSLKFIDWTTFKRITGFGLEVFFNNLSYIFYLQLVIIVIGKMIDNAAVTQFSLASRWVLMVRTLLAQALAVTIPAIAKKDALGDSPAMRLMVVRMTKYTFLLMILPSVYLCIFRFRLMDTWVSDIPGDPRAMLLLYLVIAELLIGVSLVTGPISVGIGKIRFFTIANLIFGPITLSLIWVLGRTFGMGLEGVGIAMTASFGLRGASAYYYIAKTLKLPLIPFLFKSHLPPLLVGLCLIPAVWLVYTLTPDGWLGLILGAIIAFIVFILLATGIGLDGYDRKLLGDIISGIRE